MPRPITNHYLRRIISQLKQKGVDFEPEDNILNDYDRYAYHLQLVMVNDLEAEDPNVDLSIINKSVSTVIIAESGVTAGFNIVDCEIKEAVSHNFRTKNGSSVEVEITIAEPYNMSLPDKLYTGSRSLSVKNWRLAPLFLVLYFDYYDAEGKLVPSDQNTLYKVYKLNIVELSNTLTAAGTIYKLQCAVNNNLGFSNQFYILPQTYTITSGTVQPRANLPVAQAARANTVGDFFQKLQDELNNFYLNLRRNNNPQAPAHSQAAQVVFYEFIVEDSQENPLGSQVIKFDPRVNNRRASFRQVGNAVEITAGRGLSIGNLVDDVCASIADKNFFVPDNYSGIVKVPWIECIVENIGWDALLNDYIRRFKFFIKVKETRRPIPSIEFGQVFQQNEVWQVARLQSISQSNIIRKAYLYFYTGNNTEIINLDVQFKLLHNIPLPLLNDTLLPQALSALSPDLASVQAALGRRRQIPALIDNIDQQLRALRLQRGPGAIGPQGQALEAQIRSLEQQRRTLEAEDENLRRLIESRSLVVFDEPLAQQLEAQYGTFGQFDPQAVQARSLSQSAQAALAARRNISFAEDFQAQVRLDPAALTYLADPRDLANLVRAPGQSQDTDVRKMYSSVTMQLYERRQDMVNITMDIRGDPYWLGRSNLERNRELEAGGALVGYEEFAEYNPYDAYFLLAFRAGTIPNEQTGFMELNDDVDFFNALYQMVNITHIFRDGKFTQRFEATRDLLSSITPLPERTVPAFGVGPQVVQ